MKMIHKSLPIVTAVLLLFGMLTGCSSVVGSEETKEIVSGTKALAETKTTQATQTIETTETKEGVSIEEQVLFDQNGIVVTAQKYVTDSFWGDGIKFLLENKTEKTVNVGCSALIVNDYMITDLFSVEVASGKKANETMYLSDTELKAAGIDTVGKIEMYLYVDDADTWQTIFQTDCITIKTSEYENSNTTANDKGVELYNEGGIRIVGKSVKEDSFLGKSIQLYCENNSGKNIAISVNELSVNGFMMDAFSSTEVYDQKRAMDEITILSSSLEESGIREIEEVELKFHIYDSKTYDTIVNTDAITFSTK